MSRYHYDAIVFDFDGTLVDSNKIKTWAFGKLYEECGEDIVRQVISYHRENEGVSRFVKFRHWQERLLCQHYTKEVEDELNQSYSRLVLDGVVEAPFIKGGLEFLESYHQKIPLFVASGTPENELREIIKRRDMIFYFAGAFGSPTSKAEILKTIIRQYHYPIEKVLLVGDGLIDLEVANSVGTAFLGIQLPGHPSNLPKGTYLNDLHKMEKFILLSKC